MLSRYLPAAVCVWLLASCTGEYVVVEPEGTGGGGSADGGGGDSVSARALFDDQVEPLLSKPRPKGACIGCHQGADAVNGPDFLGPDAASHYDTLTGNVRLVGVTPENSLLYTQPEHTGNSWCRAADSYAGCTADETPAIAAWINAENRE